MTITAVVLILGIGGGAFFVGWLIGNDYQFGTDPKKITPTIDGIIEKREWLRSSYYNIPFYLDVNNDVDPVVDLANVDGWNYLSVAEDEDYYYLALDLCSDRTNNKAGEWLALHIANQIPDAVDSRLAFYTLEDYGYEYLFYDVDNDVPFLYDSHTISGSTEYVDIPISPEMDEIDVYRGTTTGDYRDFWTEYDNRNFTASSVYYSSEPEWMPGDYAIVHFGVNITEKFPDEDISTFMSGLTNVELEYKISSNLESNPAGHVGIADQFLCSIYEHGDVPGDMGNSALFTATVHPLYYSADTLKSGTIVLDYTTINATSGMFYFSILGWNDEDGVDPTAFEMKFDKLSLRLTTSIYLSYIVGNSITNTSYDLAYSYGPSAMCEENHRMFEFKIAKSEFPTLADEFLYLNVAGYGTMIMENTNYWVYPTFGFPLSPIIASIDDKQEFLKFDMSIT